MAREPHEKRHALIVGAGIGGLAAALALSRAGFLVSIFERAAELGEVGAGIQLSPNATGILSDLGILHRLEGKALEPERLRVRSARSGAQLMTLPLGRDARQRWGSPMLVVHRADLQRALLDAVAENNDISLELGCTAKAITRANGRVTLDLEQDGESLQASGHLLIGADGARSWVRREARLGGGPGYSGRVAWRATVPADTAPAFARTPETALWLGARTHLVHYPLRGGTIVNIVAITEGEWRGETDEGFWSVKGEARDVLHAFRDWDASARRLLEAVQDWRRWPLLDAEPLPRWSTGEIALLGDAAHPMLPFFAQGAAQSIEDAGALGAAFMPREWQEVSITRGLADYERKRRTRAARVQEASRRQGTIYHLSGPAAMVRDLGMRALPPELVMARFDWLYGDQRGAFFT